jgi:spore germination cell wall hydrolase CwlJ-like protein
MNLPTEIIELVPECSQEKMVIVAKTIWGEARGESADGQIGVGCVIRNRVNDPSWWGDSFEQVCLKSGQFSCWTEEKAQLEALDIRKDPDFRQCLWVSIGVVYNFIRDLTRGADHYLAKWMIEKNKAPAWATRNKPVIQVGNHLFYKLGPRG